MKTQHLTFRVEHGLLKRTNSLVPEPSNRNPCGIEVTLVDDWKNDRPRAIFTDGIKPETISPSASVGETHRFDIPPRMRERGCFGFALISDGLHSTMPITITARR